MATVIARSSRHISSEHALPATCSASCYDSLKDVRILPVIMPERKLRKVERQVVFADLVIGADHAPLQQAPEAIQVRRVDVAAHNGRRVSSAT